jgi:hypothetical protein
MNTKNIQRPVLNHNGLNGKAGMTLNEIGNLHKWLDKYSSYYSKDELVEFLENLGVVFKGEHKASQLSNYTCPKKAKTINLRPYTQRLYEIYLEFFKRNKLAQLKPNCTELDIKVLSAWVSNIEVLSRFKKTALRKIFLYHPDAEHMHSARLRAWATYQSTPQDKQADSELFANLPSSTFTDDQNISTEPAVIDPSKSITVENVDPRLEAICKLHDEIYLNRVELAKMRGEIHELQQYKRSTQNLSKFIYEMLNDIRAYNDNK